MTEITVYSSDSCGVCRELVPRIESAARRKGIRVTVIDVDQCHSKECDEVRYTPLVKSGGREITMQELARMLE